VALAISPRSDTIAVAAGRAGVLVITSIGTPGRPIGDPTHTASALAFPATARSWRSAGASGQERAGVSVWNLDGTRLAEERLYTRRCGSSRIRFLEPFT